MCARTRTCVYMHQVLQYIAFFQKAIWGMNILLKTCNWKVGNDQNMLVLGNWSWGSSRLFKWMQWSESCVQHFSSGWSYGYLELRMRIMTARVLTPPSQNSVGRHKHMISKWILLKSCKVSAYVAVKFYCFKKKIFKKLWIKKLVHFVFKKKKYRCGGVRRREN